MASRQDAGEPQPGKRRGVRIRREVSAAVVAQDADRKRMLIRDRDHRVDRADPRARRVERHTRPRNVRDRQVVEPRARGEARHAALAALRRQQRGRTQRSCHCRRSARALQLRRLLAGSASRAAAVARATGSSTKPNVIRLPPSAVGVGVADADRDHHPQVDWAPRPRSWASLCSAPAARRARRRSASRPRRSSRAADDRARRVCVDSVRAGPDRHVEIARGGRARACPRPARRQRAASCPPRAAPSRAPARRRPSAARGGTARARRPSPHRRRAASNSAAGSACHSAASGTSASGLRSKRTVPSSTAAMPSTIAW